MILTLFEKQLTSYQSVIYTMKRTYRHSLFLALLAGLACTKEEATPVLLPDHAQLKSIGDQVALHEALKPLTNGYTVTYSVYKKMDEHPDFFSAYYSTFWSRPVQENPSATEDLDVTAGTTPYSISGLLNDPSFVLISDPRLEEAPYRNIHIAKLNTDHEQVLVYQLLIDLYDRRQYNQYVNFRSSFTYEDSSNAMYGPEPPTEQQIITALLNLVEPIPGD